MVWTGIVTDGRDDGAGGLIHRMNGMEGMGRMELWNCSEWSGRYQPPRANVSARPLSLDLRLSASV